MEGLDRNVRATKTALQQTPEVLQAVRVDLAIDVLFGVVDYVMNIFPLEPEVRFQFVRVHTRSLFDVLLNVGNNSNESRIFDDLGPDMSITLQDALDANLADCAAALASQFLDLGRFVHVPRFAANEGLVNLDLA